MKVLVPIDGSECSRKTLQWALHSFNKETTQYYLLNAVSLLSGYVPAIPDFVPVVPDSKSIEYAFDSAMGILGQAKQDLLNAGCQVVQSEFVLGDAVEEICKHAKLWNVDQVVIGSHGKTGLQSLILGSVSSAVMKRCEKPVLIYRNLQPVSEMAFN